MGILFEAIDGRQMLPSFSLPENDFACIDLSEYISGKYHDTVTIVELKSSVNMDIISVYYTHNTLPTNSRV